MPAQIVVTVQTLKLEDPKFAEEIQRIEHAAEEDLPSVAKCLEELGAELEFSEAVTPRVWAQGVAIRTAMLRLPIQIVMLRFSLSRHF